MLLRPSKANFRRTSLGVMFVFLLFSLCLPAAQAAARHATLAPDKECQWIQKFEDFLAFNAGREFLASTGETPASFLDMAEALDESEREQLWTMMAPMHPETMAVEGLVANGYDRNVAEHLVAQLSHEELDAMVAYDHIDGSYHVFIGIMILVVVVAILVYLIMDRQGMDHTASATDESLTHEFAAADGVADHIAQLRTTHGLERTEVPTF